MTKHQAANKLIREGRLDEAMRLLDEILAEDPTHALAMADMSVLLIRQGMTGLPTALSIRAAELEPDRPEIWSNTGGLLRRAGHIDEAIDVLRQTVAFAPHFAGALSNLAACHVNRNQALECERWARAAVAEDDKHASGWHHLALALLEQGRWSEGWPLYDWRKHIPDGGYNDRGLSIPRWDGAPVDSLIVTGEQGIGDEILFCTALRDVRKIVKHLIVECTPRLVSMFRRGGVADDVISDVRQLVRMPDAQIAMGDLPALFWHDWQDMSGAPYLEPRADLVERFRQQFREFGDGPIVGLAWRGGTKATHMELRQLSLNDDLQPVLDTGAVCVSVQYGAWGDEARGASVWHNDEAISDFDALTARIAACDVIVTVPQTAAHQAGAVGTKCLVATPERCSWQFSHAFGEKMPWYSSVQLIRQEKHGEWRDVMERIASEIKQMEVK